MSEPSDVDECLHYAYRMARIWFRRYDGRVPLVELQSAAHEAVALALVGYDPTLGVPLKGYLAAIVRQQFASVWRQQRLRGYRQSPRGTRVPRIAGSRALVCARGRTDPEPDCVVAEALAVALRGISAADRRILNQIAAGRSGAEVARRRGCSRSWVNHQLQRIRAQACARHPDLAAALGCPL